MPLRATAVRLEERAVAALEWAVIVFGAAAGLAMLSWPLGHDQGIFALNGSVVAAGGIPYRDAFETRGPLAFYAFALLRLLFGPSAWGVRVLDLAIAALTAALLYRMVTWLGSRRAARLTAAAWVLVVASLGHQDSAQFELWIGTAVLGGVLRLTRDAAYRARDLAAFGFLVGLATLTKPFYPVFLAIPGAVVLLRRGGDVAGLARDLGVLLLGWGAPIALTVGWLWARGELHEFFDVHILYSLRVYPAYAVQHGMRARSVFALFLTGPVVPTATAAAAAGFALLWRARRALAVALAVWVACGVFVVVLQGRFFLYHWTVLYPAVGLLAALGCVAATRSVSDGGRWLGTAVAAGLIAQAAFTPYLQLWQTLRFALGRQGASEYYGHFSVWLLNPADEIAAARYIRGRTGPGERIGMWALDAPVAFLADRPIAGRFSERRVFSLAPDHPITQRYRREFVQAVAGQRPTYFVINRNRDEAISERPLAQTIPELATLLQARYAPDTTFGALEILRLRGEGSAGRPGGSAGTER